MLHCMSHDASSVALLIEPKQKTKKTLQALLTPVELMNFMVNDMLLMAMVLSLLLVVMLVQ